MVISWLFHVVSVCIYVLYCKYYYIFDFEFMFIIFGDYIVI